MTEITRVPLQPVAKGTLTKLWAGVLAVVLAAAGLTWFTLPPSVKVTTVKAGAGTYPKPEDVVFVKYVGKLKSGKVFDQSPNEPIIPVPGVFPDGVPMLMSRVVPGFAEGLAKMQNGGKYTLVIPAEKAYGAEEKRNPQTGEVEIPANSDLTFEVEVTGIMPQAEVEKRYSAAMAQMQAAGGAGAEGPAGPEGGKGEPKPEAPKKK